MKRKTVVLLPILLLPVLAAANPATAKQQCMRQVVDVRLVSQYTKHCASPRAEAAGYQTLQRQIEHKLQEQDCLNRLDMDDHIHIRGSLSRFYGDPAQFCPVLKNQMPQIKQRYRSR